MGYHGFFKEHSTTSSSAKIRDALKFITVARQSNESRSDLGGRQGSRESDIFVEASSIDARQWQLSVIFFDMLIYECPDICRKDLQGIFIMCAKNLSCLWR